MSSHSVLERIYRLAILPVLLTISAMLLAGCTGGFQPMYASSAFGGPSASLAAVDIQTIPGRAGQRIRNELVFQSESGSEPVEKRYRLEMAVRESTTSNLLVSSGTARSETVNLDATFRLIDLTTNRPVLTGESYGRAPFERFDSNYANVRAERDAIDRAARTVARDMRSRLEAFLASQG